MVLVRVAEVELADGAAAYVVARAGVGAVGHGLDRCCGYAELGETAGQALDCFLGLAELELGGVGGHGGRPFKAWLHGW